MGQPASTGIIGKLRDQRQAGSESMASGWRHSLIDALGGGAKISGLLCGCPTSAGQLVRRPRSLSEPLPSRLMTPRALITGITGQDGSYLAEFLLEQGYEVHGMVRRASTERFERIAHIGDQITLHQADLLDQLSIITLLQDVRPQEVYNLAAQSFVPTSWLQPVLTGEFTAMGVTRMLEAVRLVDPAIRFYQASSSEMFGAVQQEPQNEQTPFWPRSPYGVAKVYGHWITVNLSRKLRDLRLLGDPLQPRVAAAGHGVRHPKGHRRRCPDQARAGRQLELGNLDAMRDWGYAGDYVKAMWRMLQQDTPDDYVVASGQKHSVRELVELAFRHVGLDWQDYVEHRPEAVAAGRDQHAPRRRLEGPPRARLAAEGRFCGVGGDDGRCGSPAAGDTGMGSQGLGFRVEGSGFRVQGSGFRGQRQTDERKQNREVEMQTAKGKMRTRRNPERC